MDRNQILLAIDDTEVTERVAQYVGDLLARSDANIRLLSVLPPVPAAVLELVGSSGPGQEETGAMAYQARRQWSEEHAKDAHPALERVRELLLDAGIGEDRVKLDFYVATRAESVGKALLDCAAEYDCDTVAVGYHSLPWYREMFKKHVGEYLVEHARDRTVWVIR